MQSISLAASERDRKRMGGPRGTGSPMLFKQHSAPASRKETDLRGCLKSLRRPWRQEARVLAAEKPTCSWVLAAEKPGYRLLAAESAAKVHSGFLQALWLDISWVSCTSAFCSGNELFLCRRLRHLCYKLLLAVSLLEQPLLIEHAREVACNERGAEQQLLC